MMGQRSGSSVALWSGLVACGCALTGLVAVALPVADTVSAHGHQVRASAPPVTEECLPRAGARVSDRDAALEVPGGGGLSAEEAAEYNRQFRAAVAPLRGQPVSPPDTVPVVVHVISAEDGRGDVSDARVREQVEVLNTAYQGGYASGSEATDTGFGFDLVDVTRTADDTWFAGFHEHRESIQAELREGGAETLNLYTVDLGEELLGYSSFPQEYSAEPAQDGVVVAYDSLPGGDRERFNLGHTATHEVGHWLGLFHTFQNGCTSPGDYVDDTPYEREAAVGCPEERNSCPSQPGRDPVHNFMNYSDDACMTHFTPGQAERMVEHWEAFRSGVGAEQA